MRLDIGCGNTPSGGINVDLPKSDRHRGGRKLMVKMIPNFAYGSTYNLPFCGNVFDEVVSYHLLEHMEVPLAVLKEMVCVSKDAVTVVVPAFAFRGECGEHLHTWGEVVFSTYFARPDSKMLKYLPDASEKSKEIF